jgi:malonate decarboxylase alpha subunit
MIPTLESGWVKSIHCFGSEVGMDEYVAARPDIFFTGRDGSLRSNRVLCQLADNTRWMPYRFDAADGC